jgi:hypothetical protein
MTRTIFIATALVIAVTLPAVSANAQGAIRTFVAVSGSDSNLCTITAPCRHFQTAVNATAAGGEVDALEPGAYGSFNINQAITINGQGWSYVAPPNGATAINVYAGSGNVTIEGVLLNGAGTTDTIGIFFSTGGTLQVLNCVIDNFQTGIQVEPVSGSNQIVIQDTKVANNTNAGIYVTPHDSASVTVTIDQVTADLNAYGMYIDQSPTTGTITAVINNSRVMNNTNTGIVLNASSGLLPTVNAYITNTTIMSNNIGSGDDLTIAENVDTRLSGDKIIFLQAGSYNTPQIPVGSDRTNFILVNVNQTPIETITAQ